MSVKAGQRHDFLLGHDVEDAIGKSTEERPPNRGGQSQTQADCARWFRGNAQVPEGTGHQVRDLALGTTREHPRRPPPPRA